MLLTVCLLSLCGVVFAAASGTGTISGQLQFPDKRPFNITTRITLNHGEYSTYSRVDGGFEFYDVQPGIHVLDVLSTVFHFSQVKIQLLEDEMENPKCLEYFYPGAKKHPVTHPLELKALATYEYFEERKGFSIMSILKNPMIMMMLVSVGLMFMMPKMMEGLDPEEREQMKKQMEMQQNPSAMLGQIFGDLTGGNQEEAKTKSTKKIKK